jgi:hypothetical protein
MKEQLITFETAKLAKEKGFKIKQKKGYFSEVETPTNSGYRTLPEFGFAPTQSLLQKWIREAHDIQVYSQSYTVRGGKQGKRFGDYIYVINPLYGEHVLMEDARDSKFQTYEGALEIGLQEALKLIK